MTTWRIAEGVAWVGDAERVALIDTRSALAPPMLMPPVFADLWRLLSHGPRAESDLHAHACNLVGEAASDLVQHFVESLSGIGVIERVNVNA